jgi:hypothetical protein
VNTDELQADDEVAPTLRNAGAPRGTATAAPAGQMNLMVKNASRTRVQRPYSIDDRVSALKIDRCSQA